MKIKLVGKGKMGQIFKSLYNDEIVEHVDFGKDLSKEIIADIVIDFSHHSNIDEIINHVKELKIPLLIATTGHNEEEVRKINNCSKIIPICFDANYSKGINMIKKVVDVFDCNFEKIIINEVHHKSKKDAPSGTALMLKKCIENKTKQNVNIEWVRKDDVFGIHKVVFQNINEEIQITHIAKDRNIFAIGAHDASKRLIYKKPNLYNYSDLLEVEYE